ncbi:diacylglycerol/lipid kinase family protein [Pseudoflavonifractor phocaeensis]|uniref:diacylglycerol/lipid kinase family protein n=1 Tax=Pseudoflavonifractor phocaeensis TaxID=1870988 RepID=UPI001F40484D|nr:YegS/Rv2252/BmrU family lipid kinase [Pseudoflavonifractor phocaeensis]MCF2661648.1 YegS/Rv2252/BmrU family lipid kinase [Pseudoflavonifractor phocaeensis]
MNTLLFIYNPTAGKGQVSEGLSPILDVFTKAGWLVTTYPTQGPGDAARAARELGPRFDRVVCAGGDGTLSETVTGLMALDDPPLLGYIPFGSTNDCATTLDLPKVPVQAAAIAAGEGVPRPSDIGKLNGQPFVYVAAFGAFTQVSYDTPQNLKNTFGHLAYIMEGIASLPTITPYHLKVEYDGHVLEDDFYFGMVSNAFSIGGIRLPKTEHVVLDDGLFEVDLIKKPVSIADVANGFQTLLDQGPMSAGARVHFQASHLIFSCDKPIPWTIDGEYGGNLPVNEVFNCSKALTIIRGS